MTKYDRTLGLVANCCYRKVTWGTDSYVRHFTGSDELDGTAPQDIMSYDESVST
jgi:hypothetical protein